MSRRWLVWAFARFGWPVWLRRTRSRLWAWVLAVSFVLSVAAPSSADGVRSREVRVCVRPPGVPEDLDRWVHSPGGKVMTEHWTRATEEDREITVYVFDRNAPPISATYLPRQFRGLECPTKAASKKTNPDAALRKKKPKKKDAEEQEAKEQEAEERTPKKRKAEKRSGKEREVEEPQPPPETEDERRARERRTKEEQDRELRRQLERERPKVLPRKGVTAGWSSHVLAEAKKEGVTANWPSSVLPRANIALAPAPMAAVCGAKDLPAPKPAGGKDVAASMAVREPILKALFAYKDAKGESEKEVSRKGLRALFESIQAPAAQPFRAMLESQDVLALAVRDILRNDPLLNELVGILEKKYMPAQCAPTAPSSAPQAAAAGPQGVALPAVSLTDEGAFDELHALLQQRITTLRGGCDHIVRYNLQLAKGQLLGLISVLSERLTRAQRFKVAAFKETDATKKAIWLKRAGALYAGVLVFSQLLQLYVNIGLVSDGADAMGLPLGVTANEADSPLLKPLQDFREDDAIIALTQASLDADVPKMAAALPAGSKAYERHVLRLDRWITSIQRGAVLSKKVIQVADIALIAISIYQVAKMPVVPAGSPPAPPTILGTLPGGAALGSAVSLPSLARALEAIRKLVAIGALDGALVAGVGSLGGGAGIALPELQRPTSLSTQAPGGSGSGNSGPPVTPTSKPGAEIVKDALSGLRAGQRSSVKVVKSADEMANLFGRMRAGGKPVQGSTYPGELVELPDGTRIGFRAGSKSGGATIDIWFPDGIERKVHIQ